MPFIPKYALRMTEEEYFEYEALVDRPNEYAYDVVYMRHGKNANHNIISTNVGVLLGMSLKNQSDLAVLGSQIRVWLSPVNTFRFPDVLVTKWQPDLYKDRDDCIMNPIMLVEIVSPETALIDRQDKLHEYLSTPSVMDYLLISEDDCCVEHYSRHDSDDWLYRIRTDIDDEIYISSIDCTLLLSIIYSNSDIYDE